MKKAAFLFAGLLFFFHSFGQDIGRGFKALEKTDFEKAKEVFDKNYITKKDNPAVCFGLMLVYADKTSPYYNIIEAWNMGKTSEKNISSLTVEEKEAIAEYFTNTEVRKSSWPANKKMLQAIGAVEANLIKYIREENNLDLANEIIAKFPDYRYYQNVVHIRNQLEFRKYEKQNTLEGYLEFIQKFPDAAQVEKATRYRDKLALEKAKKINTVEAYESYLKNYPRSAESSTAVKLRNAAAFSLTKQKNTIEAFEKFISAYPDALEISEAKKIQKQLLYEYARRIQSLEAYDEFIKKYPDGTQYIDIFNLKAADLGKKILSGYPVGFSGVSWAKSFDNKKFPETAGGIAVTESNEYIIAGNTLQSDSLYNDAWIIKLDPSGKMLWNKTVGGVYDDSIYRVAVNGNNEIIVLGYTYTGTDSASGEPWIFKLDGEGKKMWNRSLGKWNVTSMVTNSANEIILAGYEPDDSLVNHYKIMVINNAGKKLWSRNYISPGVVSDMDLDANDDILAGGSKWGFMVAPKGYLMWENQFGNTDSISCTLKLNDGSNLFLGTRDSVKFLLLKTGEKGNVLWMKEVENPDRIVPSRMIRFIDGKILAKGSSASGDVFLLFDPNGILIKTLAINEGTKWHDFTVDQQGNLLLEYTSGENIFVVKCSGVIE